MPNRKLFRVELKSPVIYIAADEGANDAKVKEIAVKEINKLHISEFNSWFEPKVERNITAAQVDKDGWNQGFAVGPQADDAWDIENIVKAYGDWSGENDRD